MSIPVARTSGERATIRIDRIRLDGSWSDTEGDVVAYLPEGRNVTVGDTVEVVWSFTSASRLSSGFAGYIRSQGAIGSASIWSIQVIEPSASPLRYLVELRRSVSHKIAELVPGDSGALMSGIVTGDDSGLSDKARDAFRETGTGHITAVSGSNVAMLLALWSRVFRSRTRRHHLLVQAGIILSIWMYCIATGLEASALRATTVATMVVISGRFGRRADPLTILALASAGLLLIDPSLSNSVGFWLSVAASGAIAGTFPIDRDGTFRDGVSGSIRALLAAQFATLPIVAWTFGTMSVTGIVANLLVSPVMIAAFPLTFLFAAGSFVPILGAVLSIGPAILSDLTLGIVERLAPISPMLQLEPSGSAGAIIVAIPCVAIVVWLNRDFQRWVPRWLSTVEANTEAILWGAGGSMLGLALACLAIVAYL